MPQFPLPTTVSKHNPPTESHLQRGTLDITASLNMHNV